MVIFIETQATYKTVAVVANLFFILLMDTNQNTNQATGKRCGQKIDLSVCTSSERYKLNSQLS